MTDRGPMYGTLGVQRFVYRRGVPEAERMMHVAGVDRLGRFDGALCGTEIPFDTSCNLPLGQPRCARCLSIERDLLALPESDAPARAGADASAPSKHGECQ